MKKVYAPVLAVVLAMGIALTGCGGSSSSGSSAAPAGDTAAPAASATSVPAGPLIIALQGEPTSLDAQYPDDGNMRVVTDNVLQTLFEIDGNTLEPIPCLATESSIIDELTWEFKLREGVKFHDGGDFTADDAAFSVSRILSPDYGSQILSDFDTIKEAKVVDPSTIQIITHNPDPLLLKRLTKLVMLDKEYTESKTNDELTLLCNGTGPYKLVAWKRGVDITIEKFDGFWGTQPTIEKVVFRTIEEPATRLAALQTGEINIAVNMYPEYADNLPQIVTEVGYETYWVRFNQLNGPMVDPKIRYAANLAIDYDGIAENLFLGYATPTEGQMGKEGFFGYNPSVHKYEYDPEKAQQLLQEAGYNGEVVELVSERGRWLKDGEITEAVAAMLQEAGFNVQVKFLSWNEWLDTLFDKNKTPAMQFSSTSNEFFDMDRTYSALAYSKGTQAAINNADLDKRIEEARSEMDVDKREKMYHDIAQILHDDPFAIYLLSMNDLHGATANLNWTPRQDSKIIFSEMSFK